MSRSTLRILFLTVVTITLGVTAVQGQTPSQRAALLKWDAALLATTDARALDALNPTGSLPPELAAFGKTMLGLRRAELLKASAGMQPLLSALLFDDAKYKNWVWTPYLLARTYAMLHRMQVASGIWQGQIEGETMAMTAWRFIAETMKQDPTFTPGRELFFGALLALGDRVLAESQRGPLLAEIKRRFPDPRALTAWGRSLRGEQQYDSALKVFTRAALTGEDYSRIALERARTARALGDTATARIAYWDGLERLTTVGREEYRYDLAWLVTEDSIAIFDQLPADSVLPFMHAFWDGRDAAAANHFGERLQEHLRRWVFVIANYRVVEPWRKTDMQRVEMGFEANAACQAANAAFYEYLERLQPSHPGDLRDRERVLDHRGLVYLRHGPPLRTRGGGVYDALMGYDKGLRTRADIEKEIRSLKNNISWLYWIDGEWRMLHFRGSDAIGQSAPTTLSSYLPLDDSRFYSDVATAELPEYFAAAQELFLYEPPTHPDFAAVRGPKECRPTIAAVVTKSRKDADVVTKTDSDTPPLVHPWSGIIGMYALGHAHEQTGRALLTFAIPGAMLTSEANPDGRQIWPIHFRVVAYESKTGARIEVDTVRRFLATFAPEDREFLTGWFELPIGPGSWQISVKANQGSDSSGMYSMKRELIVNNEPVLALSDLIPGVAGARAWQAPDREGFPVNTLGTWPRGTNLDLYYEVRGVPAEEVYHTTIQIAKADSAAKPLIDLGLDDRASGTLSLVRKTIALTSLEPGQYSLTLTIASNGRSVQRRMYFSVTKT